MDLNRVPGRRVPQCRIGRKAALGFCDADREMAIPGVLECLEPLPYLFIGRNVIGVVQLRRNRLEGLYVIIERREPTFATLDQTDHLVRQILRASAAIGEMGAVGATAI